MTMQFDSVQFDSVKAIYAEDDPNVVRLYVATVNGKTLGIPVDPSNTEYIAIQAWLAEGNTPEPDEDTTTWEHVRLKRDELIRESDWTMIPGCTVDQAQWAAYRQTLRDIPATYAETGPESVVWPRKPSTSGPNTIDE